MSTDDYDGVHLERRDGIATITLNDARRRNAINRATARALIEVCADIDADDAIGAVVLCGANGYFCSGGDRGMLAAAGAQPAHPENFAVMSDVYGSFRRVGALRAPTIAAIRGGAVGAGFNLALATDIRIVSDSAVLQSGFMRLGLQAGGGNGHLLSSLAGHEAAAALTLFGEAIDGLRAAQIGLAWEAVADENVEDRAHALARIPAADPELARSSARSLRLQQNVRTTRWDVALELERTGQMWSMQRNATKAA